MSIVIWKVSFYLPKKKKKSFILYTNYKARDKREVGFIIYEFIVFFFGEIIIHEFSMANTCTFV